MSFQRCAKCVLITTEFALSAEFEGAEIVHHANFSALEQSATAGCDLCRLLRQYLIHHAPTEPNSQTKVEHINHPITVSRPKGYNAVALHMGAITCAIHDGNANEASMNGKTSLSDAKPIHRTSNCPCPLAVATPLMLMATKDSRRKVAIATSTGWRKMLSALGSTAASLVQDLKSLQITCTGTVS